MKEHDAGQKLAYLDALRGIAVLLVVLVHTSQRISGLSAPVALLGAFGQMGVQLFFVVSAFTLCLSHDRRAGEPRPLASFYLRRFFRIAPLYWLAIPFYAALYAVTHRSLGAFTTQNVVTNFLFVHDFFPASANSVVPGGWSIGVEMVFYAVFPALFAAASRCPVWIIAVATGMLLAVNVGVNVVVGEMANNGFWYYSILNQLPVFGAGMAAYFACRTGRTPNTPVALGVASVGILSALALLQWGRGLAFALLPTVSGIGFAGLLLAVRGAGLRVLERLGAVSFSVYILHFVFVWALVSPIAKIAGGWVPPAVLLISSLGLVVGCTYLLAVASERFIEARGIALGREVIRRIQRPRQQVTA